MASESSDLHHFNAISNFIMISWKPCKKVDQICFAICCLCASRLCQVHWKLYEMVEMSVACNHGRYKFASDVLC